MPCDITKLRELFDRGLSRGLGNADGQVCVEGAISLACGNGLSDAPPCVAKPDRKFSIGINDAAWSSPQVCAEALWPLALAQIDTAGKNRSWWVASLVCGMMFRLLPVVFWKLASQFPNCCERDGACAAAAGVACDAAYVAVIAVRVAAYAVTDAANAAAYAATETANAMYVFVNISASDEILKLAVQISLDAYKTENEVKDD